MRALSLAIVGTQYPNKRGPTRRFELELCAPGELIDLRPEPKNPADPHAVAVYSCRDVQLGYLTAERAPWIGKLIREGREVRAIFQGVGSTCGWCRVAFDGEQPVVPAQEGRCEDSQQSMIEDHFWPDEEWPDE